MSGSLNVCTYAMMEGADNDEEARFGVAVKPDRVSPNCLTKAGADGSDVVH